MSVMTELGEMLLVAVDMPCQRFEGQQNVIKCLHWAIELYFIKRNARIITGCDSHNIQVIYFDVISGSPSKTTPPANEARLILAWCIRDYNLIDAMRIYSKSLATEQIPLTGNLEDLIV